MVTTSKSVNAHNRKNDEPEGTEPDPRDEVVVHAPEKVNPAPNERFAEELDSPNSPRREPPADNESKTEVWPSDRSIKNGLEYDASEAEENPYAIQGE